MAPEQVLSGTDAAKIAEVCQKHGITTAEFAQLQARSAKAKATAYCPYSRFRVGATLLVDGPAYVDGANVENASYPVGTCAERVAFGTAVVQGHREFRAVAVSTDISPPASPCGMCRQFIREFVNLSIPVFMFDKNQDFVVMTMGELLPMSFGPDRLPPPGAPGAMG
ncbi:unnamed protein product [Clonostachys chloroleuca]|uniref:Cytidine deaminase n=1 Tax=Clonostachys chloroleuca TaxID=1926264 RepID=A0AA35MF29_9HYPO|nr:unnamed protein product [Clonostachys chloroleuca]